MSEKISEALVIVVGGTFIVLLLLVFLLTLFFIFQRRQLRNREEKATLQAQFTQELLQTQIEVQNTTLQQISEELHDNVGQLLSVAKINLNILEETEQNAENEQYIRQANEILGQSINDLRSLTKSFDGDFVRDFGLEESLSQELFRIRKTNKYKTELHISGEKYTLGYEKEIVLFRIAQETLNNTMKHARATKIEASLIYEPAYFTLTIQDNGRGFDPSLVEKNEIKQSGAGLRNMKRRAELISGKFSIKSVPGQGTTTSIEVPQTANI